MQGYPALVDRGDSVDLVVLPGEREAGAATRLGVRRLLLLGTSAPWKRVLARLTNAQKLALGTNPHGSVPALLDDCLAQTRFIDRFDGMPALIIESRHRLHRATTQ